MSLEREMHVVTESADPLRIPLRIAIATSDLKHVNQHFGSASRLAKFEVTSDSARLAGVCEFSNVQRDGNDGKLVEKLQRLRGQHAVLSTAIGASAVRQLIASGIQPIKLGEASSIEEVLEYFQREIEVGTTHWVNQAVSPLTNSKDEDLRSMLDCDWDE